MTTTNTTRRDFLKAAAFLGGAALLAKLPWLNALGVDSPVKSSADQLRVGIIGPGSRGQFLLGHLLNVPACRIVALCDDYQPNLDAAMAMLPAPVKAYADYRKLLEDKEIDAVVIATPLHEHAHMTIEAFSAGKHVFCEKAMGMTVEECNEMVKAWKTSGKVFQIGHQRMFDVRYLRGIDQIKKGKLGPVTQIRAYWHRNNNWRRDVPSPELERKINWRMYRDYSRGLMTELCSHQIQVANWILGAPPVRVYGSGSINYWKDGREVFDNVNLVYTYANGTHFVYDSMISNRYYGLEEQVMGPLGCMELESNRFFVDEPPVTPGIRQLINDVEKKVFRSINVAGASWVPETALDINPEYIYDAYPLPDENLLQLEGFVDSALKNAPQAELVKEGFYASVAVLLGDQAMMEKRIVDWPDGLVL